MLLGAHGQWMTECKVHLKEGENLEGWSGLGKLPGVSGIFKDRKKLIGRGTFWGNKAAIGIKAPKRE